MPGDAAVAAAEGAAEPRAAGVGQGWFATVARMAIMWMIMSYFKSKPAPKTASSGSPGDPFAQSQFTSPAFDKGSLLDMYVYLLNTLSP